jgi:hypothetical protein
MNEHVCPVCGYDRLELPPQNYSICACCGTEFGYDDRLLTHAQLRREWIERGFPWFDADEPRPARWDPMHQLQRVAPDVVKPLNNSGGIAPEAIPQIRFEPLIKYRLAA